MASRLEYSKHKERSFMIQFIQTQNIGALAAYPFSPYLSDGLGRRPAIIIGASIMICSHYCSKQLPTLLGYSLELGKPSWHAG